MKIFPLTKDSANFILNNANNASIDISNILYSHITLWMPAMLAHQLTAWDSYLVTGNWQPLPEGVGGWWRWRDTRLHMILNVTDVPALTREIHSAPLSIPNHGRYFLSRHSSDVYRFWKSCCGMYCCSDNEIFLQQSECCFKLLCPIKYCPLWQQADRAEHPAVGQTKEAVPILHGSGGVQLSFSFSRSNFYAQQCNIRCRIWPSAWQHTDGWHFHTEPAEGVVFDDEDQTWYTTTGTGVDCFLSLNLWPRWFHQQFSCS